MSTRIIRLPDIGEGVTEAEVVEWQVKVGDQVTADQILGAVMTDKAAVEIPSPVAGVISSLGGKVGDVLAVGAELARIDIRDSAGSAPNLPDEPASDTQQPPTETAAKEEIPENAAENNDGRKTDDTDHEPVVSSVSHDDDVDHDNSDRDSNSNSNSNSNDHRHDRQPAREGASDSTSGRRILAAPAVRQRARDRAVDLHQVPGTGIDGRITHSDLDNYLFGTSVRDRKTHGCEGPTESLAITGLRRRIARKMEVASRSIPHFSYVEEVDASELQRLRHTLNRRNEATRQAKQVRLDGVDTQSDTRLSPLPFIILAVVRSLDEFPQINALYDEDTDTVQRHSARHVGIATQTEQGLMVPVIRHAERLGVQALSMEIRRLANAARTGRITREELTGSTITVTSLGALGGIASTPIINHPEVAIIGVNRIVPRVVMQQERVTKRFMMNLSSSFDHRIVDGYMAASFIQRIRAYLENPATLFIQD